MDLKEQKCKPCSGEEEPLKGDEIQVLYSQLEDGWEVIDNKKIRKKFPSDNLNKPLVVDKTATEKILELANKSN